MSAFCEPATTTSSPHAAVSTGTAPRLETASTTTSAPASLATRASASTSATTPVLVSECTRYTAFTVPLRSSSAASASGEGASPQGSRRWTSSAPYAATISAQRSPKFPDETTRCRSPGSTRFATADSNAPVPDAVNRRTSSSVR